ncbi:MAG TPA: hypothetical protein VGY53_01500, partial [Isosphaeraceae bacterium]|nr:hypothetical protein [Isosphaeraceae bacterium]
PGDLIDKLTMLEVKCGHLADATEREAARRELAELQGVREQTLKPGDELEKLAAQLRAVNETLWRVNEELHSCEGRGDFGAAFIELARTSLRENDRRAALVRQINECVSSVSHKQH